MSSVTVAEIKEQEDAIFSDNNQNYSSHMKYLTNYHQARAKALKQLALSEDSPFHLDGSNQQQLDTQQRNDNDYDLKLLRNNRAHLLREETEEIKRQLDFVRSQINELQEQPMGSSGAPTCCHHETGDRPEQSAECSHHQPPREMTGERRHEFVNNQQMTSADSQFNPCNITGESKPQNEPSGSLEAISGTNPRLRPLTGKTDCPNCACDRRRSVCDRCMEFQKQTVVQKDTGESTIKRQPTFITEQQISNIISTSGQYEHRSTSNKAVNYRDYDERPIRPAKQRLEDVSSSAPNFDAREHPKVDTSVDQAVVPGRVYNIGKSLNDKRTKLAQAIEDLHLMMEKLKKRGERLDQERKVAQLYKGQWRFGPTIGGPAGSIGASGRRGSCESLRGGVASSYQSRLDPNLARDSNSMMGFQHVGSSMKNLRQLASSSKPLNANYFPQQPPKPKPRLSKLNNLRLANASNLYTRPTRSSLLHARSKSIESLHTQTNQSVVPTVTKKKLPTATERLQASKGKQIKLTTMSNNNTNDQIGTNLFKSTEKQQNSMSSSLSSDSSTAVEENLEQDVIREDEEYDRSDRPDRPESQSSSTNSVRQSADETNGEPERPKSASFNHDPKCNGDNLDHQQQQRPQAQPRKKTWVPVFGESEIKTIDVRPPRAQTKVVALNSSSTSRPVANRQFKSILRTNGQSGAINKGSLVNDRVLNEASKKLQFASDLLEREQHDSRTTNQLVVNKTRPSAPPRSNSLITQRQLRQRQSVAVSLEARRAPAPRTTTVNGRSAIGQTTAEERLAPSQAQSGSVPGANQEIARLEQMISEQQALLLKLTQSHPTVQSPPAATSSSTTSTCCHYHPTTPCTRTPSSTSHQTHAKHNAHNQQQSAGRQLISNLRERLNKTKARLARTLEEERAKHQQLEQKVDSSLRKQSDLENENELLKKSLGKCIDTCLRDISITFESLSDTLSESIYMDPQIRGDQLAHTPTDTDVSPLLNNAAQLISDNRHLKRMKSHIDSIERQRRAIFEELNQEKHRSQHLELQLERSKLELEQLIGAKHRLETQISEPTTTTSASAQFDTSIAALEAQPIPSASKQVNFAPTPTTSSDENAIDRQTKSAAALEGLQQPGLTSESNSCSLTTSSAHDDQTTTTSTTTTYNSIDTYRQYIQSMTPDLDAIRRERRMILDEFDNIKKMLSDMDNN